MSAPIAYSLKGAADATGLSTSKIKAAIGSGRLRAKKSEVDPDGNPVGVWVIPAASLQAYIDGLADA
jgi:hypothetical protein